MTTKDYAESLHRLNKDTDGNIMIPLKPLELAVMVFTSNNPNKEKLAQLKALAPYIGEEDQKAIKKIIKGIKAMIKLEEKILPVASNANTLLEIGSLNQFIADFNGASIQGFSHVTNGRFDTFNEDDCFGFNDNDSFLNDADDGEDLFSLYAAEDEDEWFKFDDEEDELFDDEEELFDGEEELFEFDDDEEGELFDDEEEEELFEFDDDEEGELFDDEEEEELFEFDDDEEGELFDDEEEGDDDDDLPDNQNPFMVFKL